MTIETYTTCDNRSMFSPDLNILPSICSFPSRSRDPCSFLFHPHLSIAPLRLSISTSFSLSTSSDTITKSPNKLSANSYPTALSRIKAFGLGLESLTTPFPLAARSAVTITRISL